MISDDDFAKLSDPEFLAERARVRGHLKHIQEVSAECLAPGAEEFLRAKGSQAAYPHPAAAHGQEGR
jgi:hypothetical protein